MLSMKPSVVNASISSARVGMTAWGVIESKEDHGYIVDFAVCGDNLERILIIELNPFIESTDAALFSWKEERDKLENGPFEFRIRNEKPKGQIAISYEYRVLLGWEK